MEDRHTALDECQCIVLLGQHPYNATLTHKSLLQITLQTAFFYPQYPSWKQISSPNQRHELPQATEFQDAARVPHLYETWNWFGANKR